jgi:serpin B
MWLRASVPVLSLFVIVAVGLFALGACKKKPAESTDTATAATPPPTPEDAGAASELQAAPPTPDAAPEPPADAAPAPAPDAPAVAEQEAFATAPVADAAPLTAEEAALVSGAVNGFAADLYPLVTKDQTNAAFSPTSIAIALGMTSAGARGETAAQMDKVLRLGDDPARTRELLGRIQRLMSSRGPDAPVELAVANRLFGERTYTFEPPFLELVASQFAAPLEPVDFKGAFEPARARINAWVAEQTKERIPVILPDGSLTDLTRLVLVNAIYFKGKWLVEFPRDATKPRDFTLADGAAVQVPTMEMTGTFGFAVRDGTKLLELTYKGEELSMIFVLPPEGGAPDPWVTAEALAGLARLPKREGVQVRLPSYKVDPPDPRKMNDDLKTLGMPRAFDPDNAEFEGLANPPDPNERLSISAVFHKAFVLVDEEGTEAAAATAVVMRMRGGGMGQEPPPPTFYADRPFLFFLRDNRTGLILFAGRVGDPRATS